MTWKHVFWVRLKTESLECIKNDQKWAVGCSQQHVCGKRTFWQRRAHWKITRGLEKNKTLHFPHTDAETGLKSKVMRKVCELEPDPNPPDDRTWYWRTWRRHGTADCRERGPDERLFWRSLSYMSATLSPATLSKPLEKAFRNAKTHKG